MNIIRRYPFISLTGLTVGSLYGYKKYSLLKQPQSTLQLERREEKIKASKPLYDLKTREQHMMEVQSRGEYDVLIIGGGATGAGTVLEGASRGLRCCLIEGNDFSSGASSKSTKLIHGGIRYLQQVFEISLQGQRLEKYKLVLEALKERSYMVENAGYMNQQIPTIIPVESLFWAGYYYIGVLMYHGIYWFASDPKCNVKFQIPTLIGKEELLSHFPQINKQYKYGVIYYDGLMNDSRMNLDLLLTATIQGYNGQQFIGANILNYCMFREFIKDHQGNIIGATVLDKTNGKEFNIMAKSVVNATGCFADEIRIADNPKCEKLITPVSGTHITLPAKFCNKKYGLLIPKTSDNRVAFILPWLNSTLVGTTDRKVTVPEVDPKTPLEDIIFLHKELVKIFPDIEPTELSTSIKSKWTGLRPLVKELDTGKEKISKNISRKHVIEKTPSGLISIMGGKWTIYRKMAEDTIDEVFNLLIERNKLQPDQVIPSQSKYLRLLGEPNKQLNIDWSRREKFFQQQVPYISAQYNAPEWLISHLLETYGDRCFDVLKLCEQNPNLYTQIDTKYPDIYAEILYSIRYEMAVTPIDILFRRTRLALIDQELIHKILPTIVDMIAYEKNWDNNRKIYELTQAEEFIRKLNNQ